MKPVINFMGIRHVAFAVTVLLTLVSLGSLAVKGLNFGLDFTGGTLIEFAYEKPADLNKVREQLRGAGYEDAVVQSFGATTDVLVRLAGDDPQMQRLIAQASRLVNRPVNILVHGETGTGKEVLAKALHDQPDDDYLLYQSGKDHDVHGRYAPACEALLKALALCPAQAAYRHDLVLRTLHALKQLNRLPEAIDLAQQEMPHWSHSADFHFTVGDVLLSHAVSLPPEEAQEVLPLIEACWLRCMELGDTLTLEGAVKGRGSHLAAHNLVVFYESLGLPERAEPWRIVAASANTR